MGNFSCTAGKDMASRKKTNKRPGRAGKILLAALLGLAILLLATLGVGALNASLIRVRRAEVSLKDPAAFLCREGDWLMVHYETGKGKHRTGWVNMHDDPMLERIAKVSMEPHFTRDIVKVTKKTVLVDDPINISGTLCQLKKGAKVTVLSRNAPLIYAEATVGGKTYRGYVESKYLDRSQLAGRGTRRQ